MKGEYYHRHNNGEDKTDWHQPVTGEEVVVGRLAFTKFFPEVEIQGEIEWRCNDHSDERCEGCDGCGRSVKLTFDENGEFAVVHSNEHPSRQIAQFDWSWSGCGAREWWFDDKAICLKVVREYCSGTGLTADTTRIVAFNRKVEVDSFRGDCPDETDTTPRPGKIWAEFINHDEGVYRANWTGFAIGLIGNNDGRYTSSGGWVSSNTPVIGDDLDQIIEAVLSGQPEILTVCKHNKNVQAHIFVSDKARLPLYLCKSCRMRGVRWEEFVGRNRKDICPYFRRACKSVVGKSDKFPNWFSWSGNNLLSSHRRMQDGDWEAYEVTYVRRKEGFVRRAVVLFNLRTRESWMYRYAGFIPRTVQVFREKYLNDQGRQILGYFGTSRKEESSYDDLDAFLTESAVQESIAQGLKQPLWQNGKNSLISCSLNQGVIFNYAIQRGDISDLQIVQLNDKGEEREMDNMKNPSPFYTDKGASYYLIYSDWQGDMALLKDGAEIYRSSSRNNYYMLRVRN